MDENQERVFIETKLRNLKRKYSKLIQHSDLTDEAIEVKNEIEVLEDKLC